MAMILERDEQVRQVAERLRAIPDMDEEERTQYAIRWVATLEERWEMNAALVRAFACYTPEVKAEYFKNKDERDMASLLRFMEVKKVLESSVD